METQCRICPTCGDDHTSYSACDINDLFQLPEIRKYVDKVGKLERENKELKEVISFLQGNDFK